ncbi:hypothetical protein DV736_g6175, partial [Chaetothyriales sp. CBS 134916]
MPFPFVLSTTSQLSFQSSLTSSTHPSLPLTTTSRRSLVRSALKEHKRLSSSDKANHLLDLALVLEEYLKYLVSIDLSLSGKSISGEEVDIALVNEVEVEWRPTLSTATMPGRDNDRVKSRGLDFEIYFAHHTLALVHGLLARQSLLSLYASVTPTTEEKALLIRNATKRLHAVCSLHAYLVNRSNSSPDGPPPFPAATPDISPAVQTALQNLAHAELDLLSVLKDDPYPAVVIQLRNKDDREWMFKSPSIPKVVVQVRRRLCVGAAEKAEAALANLRGTVRVSKDLIDYCDDVRRTAKAKACRFAALDAELGGETGKAIAWLRAGMHELGIEVSEDGTRGTGLKKVKAFWNEKREDKRIAKGNSSWGADGGKVEESRILDILESKLSKENDTVNVQPVPDWRPLPSTMPTGTHIHVNDKWKPTALSEDELIAMRSPLDTDHVDEESFDEEKDHRPAGAFPGTNEDYGRSTYY